MGMVWAARLAGECQVQQMHSNPDLIPNFLEELSAYDAGTAIGLDKQWHADHYLLTDSAGPTNSPLSLILGTFETLGPDYGYGPAWIIPSKYLAAFHHALSALSRTDLVARYDVDAMMRDQVYIADALKSEGEEGRDAILEDIERIRKFAEKAAANSQCAIAMIS